MDFDFVFYGAGISAKIAAVSLLKEGFKVCIIQDKKKFSKNSNLVTFLSEGSINYLTTLVSNPANIKNYTTIQKRVLKRNLLNLLIINQILLEKLYLIIFWKVCLMKNCRN